MLKSKLYLVYNVFRSADFIQVDDMPPVIPGKKYGRYKR